MAGQEGVIKFRLEFTERPAVAEDVIRDINAWRQICLKTGLIGQDPARYDGYGFGNISKRYDGTPGSPDEERHAFLITGSQTGQVSPLTGDHYAVVSRCFPEENRVVAYGPLPPSSESMTHGILYQLDPTIAGVIHAHSPHIWRHAAALQLPCTAADVPYGTPAMAREVARLFENLAGRTTGLFVMGGHEDGVVAFGPSLDAAGAHLLTTLAHALAQP